MLVVSYADFFENPMLYKQAASLSGLKILPEREQGLLSRRAQKKLEHLQAVTGLFSQEKDLDTVLLERRFSKREFLLTRMLYLM